MQDALQDTMPFRAVMMYKFEVAGKHWYKLTNSPVHKQLYPVQTKAGACVPLTG